MDIGYVFDVVCPWCGIKNEISRGVGHDVPPSDGDVSFCFECTRPGIYELGDDGVMTMRKPSEAEIEFFDNDPECIAAVFALLAVKAARDGD